MAETHHLTPTALSNHLGCRHLTHLSVLAAHSLLDEPHHHDPALEALAQRGREHERAFLEHLRGRDPAPTVVDLSGLPPDLPAAQAHARTVEALRAGAGVVYQPLLHHPPFRGRADFLIRTDTPSGLGAFSYSPYDTKLARETRAGTVLQLCLYAELLGHVQGAVPSHVFVVPPPGLDGEFKPIPYRVADFAAYYRLTLRDLRAAVAVDPRAPPPSYPDPVPHCDICRWWPHCDRQRRDDDHLCFVAGMQTLHARELQRQGIGTLTAFGGRDAALPARPERGSVPAFVRLHAQARIQIEGRRAGAPRYELLPPEAGRGLALLPEPSPGDLFFDIEGDPFVEPGGLEYLLGWAFAGDDGALGYEHRWGLDRAGERAAFEAFVDFAMERWRRWPEMHVYHFGVYETAALKRLMCRYATREDELDKLLRGGRFVDLHQVLRQGVRCSVERYGLKELEEFHGFARRQELREASAARRQLEVLLELGGEEPPAAVRKRVLAYNREDCLSAEALRRWLEERRAELAAGGVEVARPEAKSGEASKQAEERRAEVQQVRDALLAGVPDDARQRDEGQQARWLLAQLLDYFRREWKCDAWEYFHMREREDEELLEQRKAVVGLEFVEVVDEGKRGAPVHRYSFPPQEASLSVGDDLLLPGVGDEAGRKVGSVHAFDPVHCVLDIKKMKVTAGEHPRAVFVREGLPPKLWKILEDALLELGRVVAAAGADGEGPFRAARDLLLRRGPRLRGGARAPLQPEGCDVPARARELVGSLDAGLLAIQGPPGSGKTFTGARMVLEAVKAGKRIGVTAVSHKVIGNFLENVVSAAREERVDVRCVRKVGPRGGGARDDEDGEGDAGIEEVSDNDEALEALDEGAVVGGTAWLWARPEARLRADFLFVDEAGQMSLAHVLAVAVAAENLVLLGDPQQLEQPQQGAHPEGSEVASLVHLLDGVPTMPPDKGLFLDRTWRLHPAVCAFTSEVYYEGRLKTVDGQGLERQELRGETPFAGAGLFFVPVEHEGNQACSPEEVEVVASMVEGLVGGGTTFVDRGGVERTLGWDDVLVVAPYNAQVAALQRRCPRMRAGTVDKFQGQEAPVVLYSMVSSSPEDAPRGMAFLYNPNRLNVATSRAQCAVVLVGSPRLLEPECRTVEQMKWANGLCRFGEVGRVVRMAE